MKLRLCKQLSVSSYNYIIYTVMWHVVSHSFQCIFNHTLYANNFLVNAILRGLGEREVHTATFLY